MGPRHPDPGPIRPAAVALAFMVTLATNALANILPIGGQTTGAVSDRYPTLFTPAGFTFSIWGVIYLALTGFVVYQALPADGARPLLRRIRPWFAINCLANASWIIAWHYELLGASFVIMLVILGTLVRIYLAAVDDPSMADRRARWFVRMPFSLYTAWICVATIANLSVLQAAVGVGGTAAGATIAKLALAGGVGAAVLVRWRDRAFALVVAWAAYGIAVNQVETPPVSGAAWVVVGTLLILLALSATPLADFASHSSEGRGPIRGTEQRGPTPLGTGSAHLSR